MLYVKLKNLRWKIKSLLMIFICLLFLFKLFYDGKRNYQGICSETQVKLSDAEKINLAIEALISYYPKDERVLNNFLREVANPESEKLSGKKPIPYKDLDDFHDYNKDCCEVLPQSKDIDSPPVNIIDRLSGSLSSFVKVKYKIRYFDEFRNKQKVASEVTYRISNCGYIHNG